VRVTIQNGTVVVKAFWLRLPRTDASELWFFDPRSGCAWQVVVNLDGRFKRQSSDGAVLLDIDRATAVFLHNITGGKPLPFPERPSDG
jgi:hypothetical protein